MFVTSHGAALARMAFGVQVCLWVPTVACLALDVERAALFPVTEKMIQRWAPDAQRNTGLREKIRNPSPERMYVLDMRAVEDACGIDLERSRAIEHYTWKPRERAEKSAPRGDLLCALFKDSSMALGYALMRGGYTTFGQGLASPSGAEYGDITVWVRYVEPVLVPRQGPVRQPSSPTYVRGNVVIQLRGHASGAPMTEEQLIARFDAFVKRELSRQNARAKAILEKLGVTAQIALDDKGALSVSGEVVCLSSDFPWYEAGLSLPKVSKRVALRKRETAVVEMKPTGEIETTRMYIHSFAAGPYAVPEKAEKGTLKIKFRDKGGVVFGNRWKLVFRGPEGRGIPRTEYSITRRNRD